MLDSSSPVSFFISVPRARDVRPLKDVLTSAELMAENWDKLW